MRAIDVLNKFKDNKINGFQLSKKRGILASTWLIYKKNKFYYLFDINEKVELKDNLKYSKAEFIEEFKHSYFEIDCEIE